MTECLQKKLTTPTLQPITADGGFWLLLSLSFPVIYGILGLQQAFGSPYVINDDARQHLVWMQRFLDPGLFPQDWIADYYQSIQPPGFLAFYQGMAHLGCNPLWVAKILPPILALVTTVYCYGVTVQILPVPVAGFIASLLLNQRLFMTDDLFSATSRAFLYPLFLACLYYLLRRSLGPMLVALALLTLI
ncbi:hypothetical protein [Neosynechococcus sphagnicola]|uniref:hypothetical protein n=1 Tax=Neosynechococcus sphagnicola TaxID=1501145 RepID=UPI00068DCA5C|nr:hypothetical protein [Neosynechococcus sphagnicola]